MNTGPPGRGLVRWTLKPFSASERVAGYGSRMDCSLPWDPAFDWIAGLWIILGLGLLISGQLLHDSHQL
eukprot:3643103-Alexandrium_andersonii.AAC.1